MGRKFIREKGFAGYPEQARINPALSLMGCPVAAKSIVERDAGVGMNS